MLNPEDYEYKEDLETEEVVVETKEEPKDETKEIISNQVIEKDPKYFYYIDKVGNVCKKLRTRQIKKTRTPKKVIPELTKLNLTLPKILMDAYVSTKFKTVRRTGPNGAMIWLPPEFIGRTYKVILIPKDEWIVRQLMQ